METKLFSDALNIITISIPVEQMAFNILIACLLSLLIAWTYKKTYTGVIYSKSFNITLVLVSVVTSIVMMVIRSNLALSLGLVGAVSIIRFRAALKDTRDVGFLFWGMASGLASGTGNHAIAVFGTIFITLLMFLLNIFLGEQSSYLLIVRGQDLLETELDKVFQNYSHKYKLKMKNRDSSGYELIYEVFIKTKEEDSFVSKLKEATGVQSINLLSHKGELIG